MNKMVLVPFSRYEHLMKKCESNKDPEKLDVLEEKTELFWCGKFIQGSQKRRKTRDKS